jgi:Mg2+ and Co2+ transporter CorA
MGNTEQSYAWGMTALKGMDQDDVVKFADSYLSIAAGLFLRQQFSQSSEMSYKVLEKICKKNSSNKVIAFKNAVFIALANGDLDKALEIKGFGKDCLIPDAAIVEVTTELIKDLIKLKRWEQVESQVKDLDKNPKNAPLLITPLESLRVAYHDIGDVVRAREILLKQDKYFNLSKKQKLDIPVDALDLLSLRIVQSIRDKKQGFEQLVLKFPEADFNQVLKKKLEILDQMTSQVNEVQKMGSGRGIVEAYKTVIEAYENFGASLKSFVPEGKSPEYVASFQKAMSDVYNPILSNAKKQRFEIKKLIFENKILSHSNKEVIFNPEESFKRYTTSRMTVLMERGGQK